MRKLFTLVALVALFGLGFAAPAFAEHNPPSCLLFPFGPHCGAGDDEGQEPGNNTNTSTSSSSADADAFAGVDNTNVGIQGQLGILDNEVDNTNQQQQNQGQEQGQKQGQEQGQEQTSVGEVDVDSHDSVNIEGDDVVYEAPDLPVNSAAPVFAGACSQGVSVQTQGFGGSAGSGNPVCDYVAVAGGYVAAGERGEALRVLGKAENAADWRFRFSQIRSVLTLGLL